MNSNIGDILQDSDRAWVDAGDGVQIKVMHVNRSKGVVVVLTRMQAGKRMETHYHHCTTYNYTVKGSWEYAEGAIADEGSHAHEPAGVTHTPITTHSDMVLFSVFSADNELLFTYNPGQDNEFDIDIGVFESFEKLCIEQAGT